MKIVVPSSTVCLLLVIVFAQVAFGQPTKTRARMPVPRQLMEEERESDPPAALVWRRTLCVIDREPHTLTQAQKEALEILGRLVIANIELGADLQELRNALAARDAAEGPTGESAAGLDEIISRLQNVASDLQAVREGKKQDV